MKFGQECKWPQLLRSGHLKRCANDGIKCAFKRELRIFRTGRIYGVLRKGQGQRIRGGGGQEGQPPLLGKSRRSKTIYLPLLANSAGWLSYI